MEITVTWQSIITASAVVGAIVAIATYIIKLFRWFERQKGMNADIADIRQHHEDDMADVKQEQRLIVYGVLACLKGLSEQGCNGPVTEAIHKIEQHLNEKAHQ